MKKIFIALLAVFIVMGRWHFVAAVEVEELQQVKTSVMEILDILRDERLKVPERQVERKKLVLAVVRGVFDMREMAKRSLASTWRKITPAEQTRFVDLFGKLVEFRYIGKIDNYTGQKIKFKKEVVRGNRALIYSMLLDNSTEIPIIYSLIKKDGRWRIFDLRIENVSLVVNYRREFLSVAKREGFDGLVKKIEAKVTELQAPE